MVKYISKLSPFLLLILSSILILFTGIFCVEVVFELEVLFLPFFTVTVIYVDFPFVVFAVIFTVPGDLPNTFPLVGSTDAIFVFEDVHVTTVVALLGFKVAVKCFVFPTFNVTLPSLIDIPVGFIFGVTFTFIAAATPFEDFAVIVVLPAAIALTRPLEFTDAIFLFADSQVTVLSVAFSGFIVADNCLVFPTDKDISIF